MNKKLIELEIACMKIAHEINKQRNFEYVLKGIDNEAVAAGEIECIEECSNLITNFLKQMA